MSEKIEGFFDFDTKKIGTEQGHREDRLVLEAGSTQIRIMPPWRKGAIFYKPYKMHFGLAALTQYGIEVSNWFAEPCIGEREVVDEESSRTVYGSCPVCKLSNALIGIGTRDKDETLVLLGKSLKAKYQFAANAINMTSAEKIAEGPKVFIFGKKILDALKSIFTLKGNITHPLEGRNVVVTKKEIPNQKWSDYSVMPDDPKSIMDIWPTAVKAMHNLDEYPAYSTYEDIMARLQPVFDFLGGGAKQNGFDASNNLQPEADEVPDVDSIQELDLDKDLFA